MILLRRVKPTKGQKTVCLVRYGAWGDAVMVSPVFKYYRQQGWHVTLNCTQKCYDILRTNPNIDAFILQATGEIPQPQLETYWKKLSTQFDKFINFSGSIEGQLLLLPQNAKFWSMTQEDIHRQCNVNFYDRTMEVGGFPEKLGEIGELHFKKREEDWAKAVKNKYKGFLIVWCLSGSSIHKIYPYSADVINAVIEGIPEAHVILVGEAGVSGIIDSHPRIIDMCGNIGIRKSFVLTKYADLVVSPETSVLVASGCFPTPKISLLSHGSVENVTKYYQNCYNVSARINCYPCHKLHYAKDTCNIVEELGFPKCMALLKPEKLLAPIEEVYSKFLGEKK